MKPTNFQSTQGSESKCSCYGVGVALLCVRVLGRTSLTSISATVPRFFNCTKLTAGRVKLNFLKMKKSMLTAFAVGLFMTANLTAQVPNYVPTNGLIGWWPFNGNANDESGNGNNGTVNGATLTTDRFDLENSAYYFNGNNDILISAVNLNSDWTISFWFNSLNTSPFGLQYPLGIGCNSLAIYGAPGFGINGGNQQSPCNSLQLNKMFLTDAATECTSNLWTTNTYEQQYWNHIVINKSGNLYELFVNGLNSSSGTLLDIDINNLILGKRCNFNILKFRGNIDDLGLWSRPLSAQEITNLYNANICYDYVTVTDTLIINTGITGFNPITYKNTLKIWPNPSNDHITIDAGNLATMNGYSIKIENAQGQQVFQNAVNQQQFYIDITNWGGNGLYFVRIIDPQGNTVDIKKIVLQ